MEDSCVFTRDANNFDSCCSPDSPHSIFSLKYSDLHTSRYSYFLYGFTDESDFEEFKKDLLDFQKLKRNCSAFYCNDSNNNNNRNSASTYSSSSFKDEDFENELKEDLEIVCRHNTVRKSRRRARGSFNEEESRRNQQSEPSTRHQFRSSDSELYVNQPKPREPLRLPVEEDTQLQQLQGLVDLPVSTRLRADHSNSRPDSFGLRGDFERRSYVFGYGRRSGVLQRSSINDILMEFINGDEHFLEFERVFETVNNRRGAKENRNNVRFSRRMSSSSLKDYPKGPSSPDRCSTGEASKEEQRDGESSSMAFIDDTFADFFDNDEDFLAFEKELEKFRANRLSRRYDSLSSFGSSRDIFSDVKSYCDRSLSKLNSASGLSVDSCASSGEATPTCSSTEEASDVAWKSVDDWERMFKKLRRNSCLFSDAKHLASKRDRHRHSMCGLAKRASSEQYQRTQSLADIPGSCDSSSPPSTQNITITPSQEDEKDRLRYRKYSSPSRIPDSSSLDVSEEGHHDTVVRDVKWQTAAYDSSDSDANSCDIWSDSYVDDGDNRYSSSSTLCSTHEDSVSECTSCSCSSDLHINENNDEDFTFTSSSPNKHRSQSVQDLCSRKTQQHADPMVQSGSLKKWLHTDSNPIPSDLPTSSQSQQSFYPLQPKYQQCQDAILDSHHYNQHHHHQPHDPSNSDCPSSSSSPQRRRRRSRDSSVTGSTGFLPVRDTDRWDTESESMLSEASSASSLHLTDDDLDADNYEDDNDYDQFYSAKSDFSEHFHTAKSDFPFHRRQSGYMSRHRSLTAGQRSQSADLSGLSALDCPDRATSSSSRVDAWLASEMESGVSGHDCQYTCHQLCVPSVNLNCKTISDDGGDEAKKPSQAAHLHQHPSEHRKGSLETSLSSGIHARPGGAAKVISRGASEDGTSSTTVSGQQHKVSESMPDLQQLLASQGQGQNRAMPTSQPIIESLANALGYDTLDVDMAELPKLPPPPSAIDELTVDNDDSRFITHGKNVHHHHHHRHSSLTQQQLPSHSTIAEQDESQQAKESQNASGLAASSIVSTSMTKTTASEVSPSPLSTNSSASSALPQQQQQQQQQQESMQPTYYSSAQTEKSGDSDVLPSHLGEAHAEEKDETDSGYRSGTIPDDKLPKVPSQATLDRQDLKRKITKYNHFVPTVHLEMTGKESFQGFLKVCMNLIRPITMELGARPPSIYELLTKEHIIEENTQQVAFYMPRDTYKSLHISSETCTKELVSLLLKKFHILDHPRKFAMYEQEFNDNNKLVRLRRLGDKDHPLCAALTWNPERFHNYRMVLQENETGEIVWDAFSLPELNNFLKVLDREEKETIQELRHKYAYMRYLMEKRLVEFQGGRRLSQTKMKTTSQA